MSIAPQNSVDYLRLLMDNVVDYAIFSLDTEGRITRWNEGAERILGYRSEEDLGNLGELIFTPEDRKRKAPQQEISQAATNGRAEDERWHLRKDGSRFWASGILTALKEEDGTLRGFVKILRDLTARERLRQIHLAEQERFVEQERQEAVLQERNRMAQELHDTVAQAFVAIRLHLEAAGDAAIDRPEDSRLHITRAEELARQSLAETRRTVQGLRPNNLVSTLLQTHSQISFRLPAWTAGLPSASIPRGPRIRFLPISKTTFCGSDKKRSIMP